MLWLAGLMGIVGVGAASVAVVQLQDPVEEDDIPPEADLEEVGNLLDMVGDPIDDDSEDFSENNDYSLDEIYEDFLVSDDHVEASSLKPFEQISGTDMLTGLVQDPFGGGIIDQHQNDAAFDEVVDDIVFGSDPATSSGEDSADHLPLGDWITQGQSAEVMDYETGQDSLMLVWDDLVDGAEEPDVNVAEDPYDSEVKHVLMNGRSVAEIYGDPELSAADVTVIPLSSALIVGLEPAA